MGASYSERASSQVPEPTKSRCDRILFDLQNADAPLTARTLVVQMRRNRMRDYSYALCCKDLNRLEEVGLVRCRSHPRLWEATLMTRGCGTDSPAPATDEGRR